MKSPYGAASNLNLSNKWVFLGPIKVSNWKFVGSKILSKVEFGKSHGRLGLPANVLLPIRKCEY